MKYFTTLFAVFFLSLTGCTGTLPATTAEGRAQQVQDLNQLFQGAKADATVLCQQQVIDASTCDGFTAAENIIDPLITDLQEAASSTLPIDYAATFWQLQPELLRLVIDVAKYKNEPVPAEAETFALAARGPAPAPAKIKRITQAPTATAFTQRANDLSIASTCVTQGGIVLSQGGDKLTLSQVYSEGAPSGGGNYTAIVATGKGREFVWDNTGLVNKWQVNGGEAVLRIMGRAKSAKIIGVDFCNRLHDPIDGGTGRLLAPIPKMNPLIQPVAPFGHSYVWWKQAIQIRDVDSFQFVGSGVDPKTRKVVGPLEGRVVGLIDIGEQKNTSNTPQFVGPGSFTGYGLTDMPSFTDMTTVASVTIHDCYKIDWCGNPIKDKKGLVQMWPDKTWTGTK